MILKITFAVLAYLFLVYLLLPGPESINDFPSLPNSLKSTEEGDTIQIPNIAAYFSYEYRESVIPYYLASYKKNTLFPFYPFRLNHPPEFAYSAIKDQTRSTYLEELFYPFRDSIFINGFEPYYKDGTPKFEGATNIVVEDIFFNTKTTLRFYPSTIWARLVVWLGIITSIILLWNITKKIVFNKI
ncbi:hypothetical protein HYS91_03525 [Candidatus Daviesbacteria bacterium]|nr:hypothetical protein [Candidatus Daviesbacteria bacterium]